ncbi:GIY-YIG nuclease family protein [Bacillus sp. BGMRC 2118]|nr:GIY-YIG nuclease family protein [Bacillus sp. BGMRC 2118]
MEINNHYFYVVKCSDGSLYAGYTNDLHKRVTMHNNGKGAKYTRSRTPVNLIYHEVYELKNEAMSKEYAFKQLSRKQKESFLCERGVDLCGSKKASVMKR